MEELLLTLFPLRQKVDVVDDEHVHVSEPMAKRVHPTGLDRFVERIGEGAAGDVADLRMTISTEDRLGHRLQQVGLAETDATMDEERVVGPTRLLRDGRRRCVGETIARSDDEVLEGVVGGEQHLLAEFGQIVAAGDGGFGCCGELLLGSHEAKGQETARHLLGRFGELLHTASL